MQRSATIKNVETVEQKTKRESGSNLRSSAREITKNKSKIADIYERFGKVA